MMMQLIKTIFLIGIISLARYEACFTKLNNVEAPSNTCKVTCYTIDSSLPDNVHDEVMDVIQSEMPYECMKYCKDNYNSVYSGVQYYSDEDQFYCDCTDTTLEDGGTCDNTCNNDESIICGGLNNDEADFSVYEVTDSCLAYLATYP